MNVGTEMFVEVYERKKLMVQTECHQAESSRTLRLRPVEILALLSWFPWGPPERKRYGLGPILSIGERRHCMVLA